MTKLVAVAIAVVMVGGSIAGVASTFLSGGANDEEPQAQDGQPDEDGGPQLEPVTMDGTIPLEFAVVEDASDGPCPDDDEDGLQTNTQPVQCLHPGDSVEVDRAGGVTAFPLEGSGNAYAVVISLEDRDVDALGTLTSDHVGDSIAIIARGEAILAPTVDEPIQDGMFTIVDQGIDRDTAMELARQLTG